MSANKKIRNRIYYFCGYGMIAAMVVMLSGRLVVIPDPFYSDHHITFCMETTAVILFGISWLTKAELVLKG